MDRRKEQRKRGRKRKGGRKRKRGEVGGGGTKDRRKVKRGRGLMASVPIPQLTDSESQRNKQLNDRPSSLHNLLQSSFKCRCCKLRLGEFVQQITLSLLQKRQQNVELRKRSANSLLLVLVSRIPGRGDWMRPG